jgi:hypothetical protein
LLEYCITGSAHGHGSIGDMKATSNGFLVGCYGHITYLHITTIELLVDLRLRCLQEIEQEETEQTNVDVSSLRNEKYRQGDNIMYSYIAIVD